MNDSLVLPTIFVVQVLICTWILAKTRAMFRFLASNGFIRPWPILKIHLLMTWQWLRSPSVYLPQQVLTVSQDLVLFNCDWLILKREWVYIAWSNGSVLFADKTHPTYTSAEELINKLHGRLHPEEASKPTPGWVEP